MTDTACHLTLDFRRKNSMKAYLVVTCPSPAPQLHPTCNTHTFFQEE